MGKRDRSRASRFHNQAHSDDNAVVTTVVAPLFTRHPRPWSVHPDYPRPGFGSDEPGVVMDANGDTVLGCSEWFHAREGVIEQIVEIVNRAP